MADPVKDDGIIGMAILFSPSDGRRKGGNFL
jgi:hypothetical protein